MRQLRCHGNNMHYIIESSDLQIILTTPIFMPTLKVFNFFSSVPKDAMTVAKGFLLQFYNEAVIFWRGILIDAYTIKAAIVIIKATEMML
jgi:hypothetical protein